MFRGMLRRSALVLAGVSMLSACALSPAKTEGVSGPVAWRAVDRTSRYNSLSFTLLVTETSGRTFTFTRIASTVSDGQAAPRGTEQAGTWVLPARGELRFRLQSSASNPLPHEPHWRITLAGTDDAGTPVTIVMELQFRADK